METTKLETTKLDSPDCAHVDMMTSVARPIGTRPGLKDAELIVTWGASLRAVGYAASSIAAATKRLETFGRRLPRGLLRATKRDVVDFYKYQEAAARRRRAEQVALGLKPARIGYLNHPTWAN